MSRGRASADGLQARINQVCRMLAGPGHLDRQAMIELHFALEAVRRESVRRSRMSAHDEET